jgi:ribose transport system permease protein
MVVSMVKANAGIISVLLLIGIVLSILSPVFLTTGNILSVLLQISNNMFLALGMTLVIILGGIDLSVGSVVALTGTLTVGFVVTNGLPLWLAIILGLLIGTVCGCVNGIIVASI